MLGVRVDCITLEEAVAAISGMLRSGRGRRVATVNPEFVMRARRDPPFARLLERSDLCLPDGQGVVWALRRSGCRSAERVAGVDLLPALASACVREGRSVFLLGAAPGVAEAAGAKLLEMEPGLRIAGTHAGDAGPAGDGESATRIRASGADLVLVAYGAPAQERWIDRNLERCGARVAIGVGGAFDFLSGRVRRAPAWMRGAGLEWLHRLIQEPWRLRRMAVLPVFALMVSWSRSGAVAEGP